MDALVDALAPLSLLGWGDSGWGDEIVLGIGITLALAVCTLPIGLAGGLGLAVTARSGPWWARDAALAFTAVFRGLPELLTLFLLFYGGQAVIQQVAALFGVAAVQVSPFLAGVLAFAAVFAAFSSEVFASAFKGISQGQWEGAAALGLKHSTVFARVIAPQLLKLSLPGLSNLWLILLKDTALISVLAVNDLMRQTRVAAGSEREAFFFYGVALLVYLGLSLLSSLGLGRLDAYANRGAVR